jgi:hypothetical protein
MVPQHQEVLALAILQRQHARTRVCMHALSMRLLLQPARQDRPLPSCIT